MIYTSFLSLFPFQVLKPSKWVGLKNYSVNGTDSKRRRRRRAEEVEKEEEDRWKDGQYNS